MNTKLLTTFALGLLVSAAPFAQADHGAISIEGSERLETIFGDVIDVGGGPNFAYKCVGGNDWHYCGGVLTGSCIVKYGYKGVLGEDGDCVWIS